MPIDETTLLLFTTVISLAALGVGFAELLISLRPFWERKRDQRILRKAFGRGPFDEATVERSTRYYIRPKYTNIDASFFKNFRLPWLGEQGRLQFRAEFFNLLNHASFSNPNGTMSSSNFGVITSDNGSPRIGQFALKLYF